MNRKTADEIAPTPSGDDGLTAPTVAEGRMPYDVSEPSTTIPTASLVEPPEPLRGVRSKRGLTAPRADDTVLDTTAPVRMPDEDMLEVIESSALSTAPDGVPRAAPPDDDPDGEASTQVAQRPAEVMHAPVLARVPPGVARWRPPSAPAVAEPEPPPAEPPGPPSPSPRVLAGVIVALGALVFVTLWLFARG